MTYTWETKFLELLIDPNEAKDRWSDIALEPDVKDTMIQLIN